MRQHITKLIAILVVVGAFYGKKLIVDSKEKIKPVTVTNTPTANVISAKNKIIPVNIKESGLLTAKNKIELFSEVQGVMESTSTVFKPGATFRKGQTLVKIKSEDHFANLQAQKSVLQNLITSILPDIKLDYPDAFNKWNTYLNAFDMEKPLTKLPEPSSDKEKFFLTGKNLYTTYYNTRNLEIVYSKYTLTAPFNGVLTEALVTPGSLVRNGQKLGEFIDPSQYELELSISKNLIGSIVIGKEVEVNTPEDPTKKQTGKVSRINGKVDNKTQTIQVYVTLKNKNLKEGMYLEAQIAGQEKLNAIELSRNSLVDGNKIYIVNSDSTLDLHQITVTHKTRTSIIVQGIPDETLILNKPIPGAYAGMKVLIKK